MQKLSLENPLSLPRNRQKTEMISLGYDVNDHLTSNWNTDFSQYRSCMDFDITLEDLYEYWLILRLGFGLHFRVRLLDGSNSRIQEVDPIQEAITGNLQKYFA